jgi:hypothetical protein
LKNVCFSLYQDTAEGITRLAKSRKVSKSDVVREMYARMQLEKTLEQMQAQAAPLLQELGLNTEDDIAAYGKSK